LWDSFLTTSLALQELTVAERAAIAYHAAVRTEQRKYRADLERALEADTLVHVLNERAYIAQRRESFLVVPCMRPHYPNPNYPVPAQLLPGVHFQRPAKSERTLLDRVLGKPVLKSYFTLPVGRKPSQEQLQEHTELLINGDPHGLLKEIRLAGYEDSDREEDEAVAEAESERLKEQSSKKAVLDSVAAGRLRRRRALHACCIFT
jgi:hypothetical protein